MKRLATPVILFLLMAIMMASLTPVAANLIVSDPADCPAGTTAVPVSTDSSVNSSVSSVSYECVEDPVTPPVTPPDTCTQDITPCEPPPPVCATSVEPCDTPTPVPQHVAKPQPPKNDDGSVSFNDSDLGVSLFVAQDASGRPMLQVYETPNNDSDSNYAMTITQDDLVPFVGAPPAENTLLKSQGHVRIYVLTTGEISILVGPDSEGKIHVKIFDGIPWSKVYGYTIDPQ